MSKRIVPRRKGSKCHSSQSVSLKAVRKRMSKQRTERCTIQQESTFKKKVVAAVGIFDLCQLSEAASRIEHAVSWNDAGQRIDEYGE